MSTPQNERPLTLLEKYSKLEAEHNQTRQFAEHHINKLQAALGNLVELLAAMMRLQGEGTEARVEEEIQAGRRRRAEAQLAKAQGVLQSLIDSKQLVVSETITKNSLLVGRPKTETGELIGLGTAQLEFSQFDDAAQADLLGKGVGAITKIPEGSFEVTAIYVPNPEAPKAEAPAAEETPAAVQVEG